MSAADIPERTTFRRFALGADGGAELLTQPIGRSDVIQSMGAVAKTTRGAVAAELASAVAGVLDFDLFGVIVSGWKKYDALLEAGRRTAADPSTEEVVELATHRITSVHRPTIDLLLDGVRIGTLHVEATFECVLEGLVATVSRGRLVRLGSGRCNATATVSAEGVEIARREGVLDLHLETSLGAGIPLVTEALASPRRTDHRPGEPVAVSELIRPRRGVPSMNGEPWEAATPPASAWPAGSSSRPGPRTWRARTRRRREPALAGTARPRRPRPGP